MEWQSSRLLSAALAILLIACRPPGGGSPASGASGTPAGELLARAEALASEERYFEAVRLLKEALTGAAELPEVRARIARYQLLSEFPEAALEEIERALRAEPDSPESLWVKGEALRRLERVSEARSVLERLVELAPDHTEGRLALARTWARLAETAKALACFEAYLSSAGGAPQAGARLDYSRALTAAGRPAEAVEQLAQLLETEPEEAGYYHELSKALFRLRRLEEAKFFQAIYDRVSQAGFEELVEERLRNSGRAGIALGQEASNLMRKRRFCRAFKTYRRAMALEPGEPRMAIYYAGLCLTFGRIQSALTALEACLKHGASPASGLHLARGRVLRADGRTREAVAALKDARRALAAEGDRGGSERGQADPFTLASELVLAAAGAPEPGTLEEARTAARELCARQPYWMAEECLGLAELVAGNPAGALEALERSAAAGGGRTAEGVRAHARALAALGRGAGAVEGLQEVIRRGPEDPQNYQALTLAAGSLPPDLAAARDRAVEAVASLEASLREADSQPLEACAPRYLEAAKLARALRDPLREADFLFLAVDLDPDLAEGYRQILSGLTRNEDVFVRIHFLRELVRLDPDDPAANRALARLYLKLRMRLEEAQRAADRLRSAFPSSENERLLQEVSAARKAGS